MRGRPCEQQEGRMGQETGPWGRRGSAEQGSITQLPEELRWGRKEDTGRARPWSRVAAVRLGRSGFTV